VNVVWSRAAQRDLSRHYRFIAERDAALADDVLDHLIASPEGLATFPRRGSPVERYKNRDVRQFRAGNYLLRYEVSREDLRIVRVFHVAENRD
jgi:plasmid stabilization system protein ParE